MLVRHVERACLAAICAGDHVAIGGRRGLDLLAERPALTDYLATTHALPGVVLLLESAAVIRVEARFRAHRVLGPPL